MEGKTGSSAGFTLIEMLVALVLLALISSYGAMALSSLQKARQVEKRLDSNAEVASVRLHLQQTLSDMRVVFSSGGESDARLFFKGEPNSIEFVSRLDDRVQRGGLYRLSYRVRDSAVFGLNYLLFRPRDSNEQAEGIDLLSGVSAVVFRYFGDVANDGHLGWTNSWPRTDELPRLVSMTLQFSDGDQRRWPPLVVKIEEAN